MPNVMVSLPNIGGALCSTPQISANAHYYKVPCSTRLERVAALPCKTFDTTAANGLVFVRYPVHLCIVFQAGDGERRHRSDATHITIAYCNRCKQDHIVWTYTD